MSRDFDVTRAQLGEPDLFQRYRVPARGERLADAGLSLDTDLMVIERAGSARALLIHQLTYHHLAQGELGGEPYLVSF